MTRILGIDPGSQRTGVGIIDVDAAGRVSYVHHQPLVLLGADDFPQRMKLLVLGWPTCAASTSRTKWPSKRCSWRAIPIRR